MAKQLSREAIDVAESINYIKGKAEGYHTFGFSYIRLSKHEESKRQKDEIEVQKKNVEKTLEELKETQKQLIQREKMASLGELTAGIAHEIRNPLNFVNNFSDILVELLDDLKKEVTEGNKEVIAIADDIAGNLQKVVHCKRHAATFKVKLWQKRTNRHQRFSR